MNNGIHISQFYNKNTLNIFSDASMNNRSNTGCYGVVAVVEDDKIDGTYRLVSNSTSNNSEIKGIRAALDIALKYKNQYRYINIFSDSLISINGLRTYIHNWRYNKNDGLLYGTARKPIANQEIFIEAHEMLMELEESECIIALWHQSGHVKNDFNHIQKAAMDFKSFNNISGKIDYNFIRYISVWNDHVDKTSRSLLRRNIKNDAIYFDPLIFFTDGKL